MLEPCPHCKQPPEIVDNRLGWFVRCSNHEPPCPVVYGHRRRDVDECETDDESEALVASIDWAAVRQTAVDNWNRWAVAGGPELSDADVLRQVNGEMCGQSTG